MATIRPLASGKFNVQVRRFGHRPISKTFHIKQDAERWARTIESEMDRGAFTDRSEAEATTLGDALIRYGNEVTPSKKSWESEGRRIKAWLVHPLAKRSLASLQGKDFARYRDDRLKIVSNNTVRLELALVSHVFKIAQ